jgi:hypothetical protein
MKPIDDDANEIPGRHGMGYLLGTRQRAYPRAGDSPIFLEAIEKLGQSPKVLE